MLCHIPIKQAKDVWQIPQTVRDIYTCNGNNFSGSFWSVIITFFFFFSTPNSKIAHVTGNFGTKAPPLVSTGCLHWTKGAGSREEQIVITENRPKFQLLNINVISLLLMLFAQHYHFFWEFYYVPSIFQSQSNLEHWNCAICPMSYKKSSPHLFSLWSETV